MNSEMTSSIDGALEKKEGASQDIATDNILEAEVLEEKYPGCFKKSVAFLIDQIIIAIIGIVVFLPFSNFMGSLYQHGWFPAYLVGAVYFIILESTILKGQSIGKMVFSFKVNSITGEGVSPIVSFGRYFLITLPFMNGAISNSLASTIGITNTVVGGTIFILIIGVLLSGNTLFMLFHPQKRGFHDMIFKTVVVPVNYKPNAQISNITTKPMNSGIIGLAILGLLFGNLFFKVGGDPDFSDIYELSDKIRQEISINNISASYRTFSMNGKQTMFSIEVRVPIPYDKFDDKEYTEGLSNKLYPLVKNLNTNPNVDTISMVFHAQKYIGAMPLNKTSRNPKKIAEIE